MDCCGVYVNRLWDRMIEGINYKETGEQAENTSLILFVKTWLEQLYLEHLTSVWQQQIFTVLYYSLK